MKSYPNVRSRYSRQFLGPLTFPLIANGRLFNTQKYVRGALWLSIMLAPSLTVRTVSAEGLSGGAVAGVVIGTIAGVIILAALVFFCCCRPRCNFGDLEQAATYKDGLVANQDLVASPHVVASLDAHDIEMIGGSSHQGKDGTVPLSVGVLDAIRNDSEPKGSVAKEKHGSMLMRWLDDHLSFHDASAVAVAGDANGTASFLPGGAQNGSAQVPSALSPGRRSSRRMDAMSSDGISCFGNLGNTLFKRGKMSGVAFHKMPPSNVGSPAASTIGGSTRITTSTYRRGPNLGEGLHPQEAGDPTKANQDRLHPEEHASELLVLNSARSNGDVQAGSRQGLPQGVHYNPVNVADAQSRRSTVDVSLPVFPTASTQAGSNVQLPAPSPLAPTIPGVQPPGSDEVASSQAQQYPTAPSPSLGQPNLHQNGWSTPPDDLL